MAQHSLIHSCPEPMDLAEIKTKRPRHLSDIRAFSGASSMAEGTSTGFSEVCQPSAYDSAGSRPATRLNVGAAAGCSHLLDLPGHRSLRC